MATLADIRSQYPQYQDMSDAALADALHRKFYSDIPRQEFEAKVGLAPPAATNQHLTFEEGAALVDREERATGASGAVGAALTGYIDGIPVLGPALLGGAQRLAAGAGSLINGESYSQNLSKAQAVTEASQEAHPYITAGANVAGGVVNTVPMVMAAPGAFGAGSGPLISRSLASMATGAGLGTADAAVRSGGDIDASLNGTMWGAGAGALAPVAGHVIGKGVRAATDAVRTSRAARAAGTSPYALDRLGRAVTRDGLDPAMVQARLQELGPEGLIADLGPNLQGQAAALANMPGRANSVVRDALNTRHAGANGRLSSAIDDTLGRNVIPSQVDDALRSGQEVVGWRYEEVFRNARAADTQPVAEALESQIVNLRGDAQQALKRVRSMLNIEGTDVIDPHPGALFQTRQAIDGMLAVEANPQAVRALAAARQQVDDVLARAAPGIKEVDAQFAELARQREALVRGQSVLDHGRTAPRPAELAAEVQEGALPQGRQVGPSAVPLRMSQGARAEIDRILGSNANDIAALNRLIRTDGDWNRTRLTTLFGSDKAERLFGVLDNELTFANTRNFALGNSATAGRQQAISELGGASDTGFGIKDAYAAGGVAGALRGAALRGADKVLGGLLSSAREGRNASLADAITGNREAVIRALMEGQTARPLPVDVDPVVRALLLTGATTGAR
jgi:hypothetical protein